MNTPMDRQKIENALDDGRLFIKTSDGFFMARRHGPTHEFPNGSWLVQVRAKMRTKGFVTNVDNNKFGNEFRISPKS